MHTLYAEGQRRYMETFSPYVRQFMDRMDKPDVDAVENILPAIALHQRNSVRTSRSTVGTMTGLNDYWKFVFARLAVGIDPETGREIKPETPGTIDEKLHAEFPAGTEVMVCLEVARPESVDLPSLKRNLVAQGYLRAFAHGEILRLEDEDWTLEEGEPLLVVQDRVRLSEEQAGGSGDGHAPGRRRGPCDSPCGRRLAVRFEIPRRLASADGTAAGPVFF